jgi:ABC-type dipeptide/oligopeptide/nickel transport system ATPase component
LPAIDVVQLVHSTVERNREIPAVLDAYSEFLDSPIGQIELKNLSDVFERIQDNLSQRFPDVAARRAGNQVRNDVAAFLSATNGDPDRLKQVLRDELLSFKDTMVASIAERFSRMSTEEKRTIDATLRLIYRSPFEILFRADAGKQLASSGREFERFFAVVKSQSPMIRELRFENLIVEKAIFNKLILKAQDKNYFIWIPSFFAKEWASSLIQRVGLSNEHIMLARLRELSVESKLEQVEGFLRNATDNLGVLGKNESIPSELSDFVQRVGDYQVIPPIDLDDVYALLQEEAEKKEQARVAEIERQRLQEEMRREEQTRKTEQFRQRLRPVAEQKQQQQTIRQREQTSVSIQDSIYLGKRVDFDQLVSAINRRVPEKEFQGQVRQTGDYILQLPEFRRNVAIVGSSGSGRSTTLKRILDGIASKAGTKKIIVIDQKGEHRGLAWKYGWKVFSFASDSQAQEFQVSLFPSSEDESASASFDADLLQEWFNQGSLNCTDQQKERIASIIRAIGRDKLTMTSVLNEMAAQADLSELAQKLRKGLVSKSTFSRIFAEKAFQLSADQSTIYDVSGRGLRDPTTREERQIISAMLLQELSSSLKDSIIVLEDTLDRFKSDSLKGKTIELVRNLAANGNTFIVTSRSTVREFFRENRIELVHRLSGEKVIADELSAFESDVPTGTLQKIVSFLPRGYLITSKYRGMDDSVRTAGVRVEPLTFS